MRTALAGTASHSLTVAGQTRNNSNAAFCPFLTSEPGHPTSLHPTPQARLSQLPRTELRPRFQAAATPPGFLIFLSLHGASCDQHEKVMEPENLHGYWQRIVKSNAISRLLVLLCFTGPVIYFVFVPTPNYSARANAQADISRHLGRALNRYYAMHGTYPFCPSGTRYCNGEQLKDAGLFVPEGFEFTNDEAGRGIRYRGALIDPFRREKGLPAERMRTGRYYHSNFAELSRRVRGYPLLYYRSDSGEWALVISSGPDEDVDINENFLLSIDDAVTTEGDFPRLLCAHLFNIFQSIEQPRFHKNRGPWTDGDIILTFMNGNSPWRIDPQFNCRGGGLRENALLSPTDDPTTAQK